MNQQYIRLSDGDDGKADDDNEDGDVAVVKKPLLRLPLINDEGIATRSLYLQRFWASDAGFEPLSMVLQTLEETPPLSKAHQLIEAGLGLVDDHTAVVKRLWSQHRASIDKAAWKAALVAVVYSGAALDVFEAVWTPFWSSKVAWVSARALGSALVASAAVPGRFAVFSTIWQARQSRSGHVFIPKQAWSAALAASCAAANWAVFDCIWESGLRHGLDAALVAAAAAGHDQAFNKVWQQRVRPDTGDERIARDAWTAALDAARRSPAVNAVHIVAELEPFVVTASAPYTEP